MLTEYFQLLSDLSESGETESTRLAALHSLQNFAPVLQFAFQNPDTHSSVLPAICTLLSLLSDDEYRIRELASQITATILGLNMPATPMGSEEKLSNAIGNTMDIEIIERNIIPILCKTKVDDELASDTDDLFARERDNVWRDEIYQYENYLKILARGWMRQTGSQKLLDTRLLHYALEGIEMIEGALGKYDKNPVGWGRDNDVCETIMKISLLVDLLNRHGKIKIIIDNHSQARDPNLRRKTVHITFPRRNLPCSNCGADSNIEGDPDETNPVCCRDEIGLDPRPPPEFETDLYTATLLPVNSKHPFAELFEKDLQPKIISGNPSSSVLGKTGVAESCTFLLLTLLILANSGDMMDELERKNGIIASLHVLHNRVKSSLREPDLE